jgi:SAM-dependent methyltransferase
MSQPSYPFSSLPCLDPLQDLIDLHLDLPRKGPGSRSSTLRALEMCGALPKHPSIADLGCGAGASSLVLAEALASYEPAPILALDACGPFLNELWLNAQQQHLRINPVVGDMSAPNVEPGSLDLIWSEGAIFVMGFEEGLRTWKELLRPGGKLVVSESTWFMADPPEPARRAWEGWYPAIQTLEENLAMIQRLGYDILGHFAAPADDWWNYYQPLEKRCLEAPSRTPAMEEMLNEIDVYRNYGHSYGYAFYVLSKPL